ncbi:odorant receptor 67c-like [Vespula squamosa]|uniref:Odorant receptor 67c-like n=1 Tax=Vespula squamosa TaxID=30214 RepID=A0ABD2C1I6_VESSQ
MDTFDHPYYKVNKHLLTLIGQWPLQKSKDSIFRRYYRQVALLYTTEGNIDILLEYIPFISCFLMIAARLYTYEFQRIKTDSQVSLDHERRKIVLYDVLDSIKNHKKVLEFAELLESCFSLPFLMQFFTGLVCSSVSMFQTLILLDKKTEALRFFTFSCGQLVHFLSLCYPGQRMIDYSTEIRTKA